MRVGNRRKSIRRYNLHTSPVIGLALVLILTGCGGSGGETAGDTAPLTISQPAVAPADGPTEVPAVVQPPNVLLIMADDLGFNDLAVNNLNTEISTPNMDALSEQGVRFTAHYANTVCTPARVALLTGQYAARHGVSPNSRGISTQVETLPDRLSAAGYQTRHVGKWHAGNEFRNSWPDRQGFDQWFGFLNQGLLAGRQVNGELVIARPTYIDPFLIENDDGQFFEGHLDDLLAERAIEDMDEMISNNQPWFLNLWFYAPHTPLQPSDEFAAQYPDTDEGRLRALIDQLDANIGRVLEHLDNSTAADNTLVVMVSDNGGTNIQFDNNAPFFGDKGDLHEGALRTPMIIRWPDNFRSGQTYAEAVTIYDLYPTILASLGIETPEELDGLDIRQQIENGAPQDRPLFWEFHSDGVDAFTVLSQERRWRFTRNVPLFVETPPTLADFQVLTDGSGDFSAANPDVTAQLFAQYVDWHRDVRVPDLEFSTDSMGHGEVTGMDMVRTPGFNNFGFAIGVQSGYVGSVAEQQGVWSLETDGQAVSLNVDGLEIQGALSADRDCHSVIVSGNFTRPGLLNPLSNSTVRLYLDGALVGSETRATAIDDSNYQMPTVIGSPAQQSNFRLSQPLLVSALIESSVGWSISDLDQSVCQF